MEKYMKKYCSQMDKIILPGAADQKILLDLLKAVKENKVNENAEKPRNSYTRRNLSAAAIAAIVIIASAASVFAGVAIHHAIIKSNKTEVKGFGTTVNLGESVYFDLLSGTDGEIYALTDSDCDGQITDHHVIVWKSTDEADTWEEMLSQPSELNDEAELIAGDLREGENGIEAVVIIRESNPSEDDVYTNRVYCIQEDSCEEYNMDEAYALLGSQDHLFNIKYVNAHTLALVGTTGCLLYDMDMQEIVKELPYNLTMGCLLTQNQFLLYGNEIYTCIDVNTLNECEPEVGLQDFVRVMVEKNNREVFPPIQAQGDTVASVTNSGIFEYREGEIVQVRQLSKQLNGGHTYNGLLPFCKSLDGKYYVCTFTSQGMALWQIDSGGEEMKQPFSDSH